MVSGCSLQAWDCRFGLSDSSGASASYVRMEAQSEYNCALRSASRISGRFTVHVRVRSPCGPQTCSGFYFRALERLFALTGSGSVAALAYMKARRPILCIVLLGCLVNTRMFSACQGAPAPRGGRGPILREEAMSFPFDCESPFFFAVYHLDHYPPGKPDMTPNASLKGHRMGADFGHPSGWNMSRDFKKASRSD